MSTNKGELFTDLNLLEQVMINFVQNTSGRAFILVMKVDEGYMAYRRVSQPCYGELRKYAMTHGTMCTRPESEKPDDLYWPFPEGKPFAVGVPFNKYSAKKAPEAYNAYTRAIFSDTSPWIKGFGSSDSVTFISDAKDPNRNKGVIFRDMHVDPTVMVSAIWATCYTEGYVSYLKLLNDGFTQNEALAIIVMNTSSPDPYSTIYETDNYHWPAKFSLKRFLSGNPHDYSGGFFDEGYDYNRRMIQDIFYSKNGLHWQGEVSANLNKHSWGAMDVRLEHKAGKVIPAIRKALDEGLAKEGELYVDENFSTKPPVMNIVDGKEVFQIHQGWGTDDTGYDDDCDDDDDDYNCGDPNCPMCN